MDQIVEDYYTDNGYHVQIMLDDSTESPREWDNATVFALFHNRHNLPNETDLNTDNYGSWDELLAALIDQYDPAAVLPVYAYDHSCFVLSTCIERGWYHAAWDSGQVGFAFITREAARREWDFERITAKRLEFLQEFIRGDVETYSQYVNGEVYLYIVESPDGDIDSCGGFYDLEYCKQEADR